MIKYILIAITDVMPKDKAGNIIDKCLHSDLIDAVQQVKNCSTPNVSGSIPEFAKKQIEAKKDIKRLKGGQRVGCDVQLTELDVMDLIVTSIQNYLQHASKHKR